MKNVKVLIPRSIGRILLVILLLTTLSAWAILAVPEGAQLAEGHQETRTAPTAETVSADGGNITSLNISASTQTTRWQGFFGQVNGSIVLSDNSGDTFYSWNLTNTSGEVYASRDSAIAFASIEVNGNCSIDEILVNQNSVGEIPDPAIVLSDSVNQTFTRNHSKDITVGTRTFNDSDAITACATNTYVNSAQQSDNFHEMILTDDLVNNNPGNESGGVTSVYATLIEGDIAGFDGGTNDYQLIVPVNTSEDATTYSFYAEIG